MLGVSAILGAMLGWRAGQSEGISTIVEREATGSARTTSILGERRSSWFARWEDALKRDPDRPFRITNTSHSSTWDANRRQLAFLAHKDPHAAIAWIRENLPEDQQRQQILDSVFNPLMAADFREGLKILSEVLDGPLSPDAFHWLFQYVPVGQLPEVAGALRAMDLDDASHRQAFLDFIDLWASTDLQAAAKWVREESTVSGTVGNDLRAYIEAARVREGAIPEGLASSLRNASERMRTSILQDLYAAALALPGNPAEHAEKILSLTPEDQQRRYATSFVSNWARSNPRAATDWALSFADPEIATELLIASLTVFNRYSPEKADAWEQAQDPADRVLIEDAQAVAKERSSRLPPP